MKTITEKCRIITRGNQEGTGTLSLKSKRNIMGDISYILSLHNIDFKQIIRSGQVVKIKLLDGRELKIDNVSWIPLTFLSKQSAPDQYQAIFHFTRNFEIK